MTYITLTKENIDSERREDKETPKGERLSYASKPFGLEQLWVPRVVSPFKPIREISLALRLFMLQHLNPRNPGKVNNISRNSGFVALRLFSIVLC